MLHNMFILIVEDEAIIALELAASVRECGGMVVGPVASVAGGTAMLEQFPITAAILDANLVDRDITPLALTLADRGIPFVVQSGKGLPPELATALPDTPIVMKPTDGAQVVSAMIAAMKA